MQYNNAVSWFNSPSLPSPSTLSDQLFHRSADLSYLPTSQRRAPSPPTTPPRRNRRRRFVRMYEPASKGLFTLLEVDEGEEDEYTGQCGYSNASCSDAPKILSARASSEALSHSPIRQRLDLPQDVAGYDGDVLVERRLSWVSTTTCDSTSSPPTPSEELDDPFFVDVPLDIDVSDIDTSYASFLASCPLTTHTPRRPPPLDLSRTHSYAHSAEINRWYTDVEVATPQSSSIPSPSPSGHTLLPALPIIPSPQNLASRKIVTPTARHVPQNPPDRPRFLQRKSHSAPMPSTVTKGDPFDLVAALEDLLASCGEPDDISPDPTGSYWSDSDSNSDDWPNSDDSPTHQWFPLPPPRTPTLSPLSASSTSSFDPITPRTPRIHTSLPPMPTPHHQKKRTPIQPRFTGDHSFLFDLSAETTPLPSAARVIKPQAAVPKEDRPDGRRSSKSRESGSIWSGKLPSRSRLPVEWTKV